MCMPLVSAGVGIFQAFQQYQGQRAQASYLKNLGQQQEQIAAYNLKQGETRSNLVQESASMENKALAQRKAEIGSSQKAEMVASGVDLSSVTAQDITTNTLTKAKMDEMMLRRNANLYAWNIMEGAKVAAWQSKDLAAQYNKAYKNARSEMKWGLFSTLLGSAMPLGNSISGLFGKGTSLASQVAGFGGGTSPFTPFTGSTSSLKYLGAYR